MKRNLTVGPLQAADEITVKLRYPIRGTLAAAATVISKRYTVNGAYDVDPVLGSTATPGYAEYAALYTYYRVQHVRVKLDVCNLDNLGVALYWTMNNQDPGTAGTNYYNYASTTFGGTANLAPFYSGRGTHTIRQDVSMAQVVGMTVAQADSFRSVTTSVPTDLVYWGFGIYSDAGTNFSNGVAYAGWIEMTVRFYARNQLLTTFLPSPVELEAARRLFKEARFKRESLALAKREKEYADGKAEFERQVSELCDTLRGRISELEKQRPPEPKDAAEAQRAFVDTIIKTVLTVAAEIPSSSNVINNQTRAEVTPSVGPERDKTHLHEKC
jgi:hypothetical protein